MKNKKQKSKFMKLQRYSWISEAELEYYSNLKKGIVKDCDILTKISLQSNK